MSDFDTVLGLGDDVLIAAQRLAEWTSRAHDLEEDIALSNIALDLLGQARALLTHAGHLEGAGRDEDALAFLRDDRQFRNVLLVELPRGDFATTIVRLLFLSARLWERYTRLSQGEDATLAAIAAKAVKETAYHLDHAAQWTIRLGDGTEESHARAQRAVDEQWPYTFELTGESGRQAWLDRVVPVLDKATLTRPDPDPAFRPGGGRDGLHSEHLGYLLAEMQHLHRSHPGATW
ncbi:1,2-phenylacetyl-CoA epoxidase subunit PaaC [Stackebrandtia nassauensis]|uniref:Phenylacetate-CoA oxygenase, PaaI subunit n=1 Tax=Stackebrandtia nassauensis (strain DSM 44728 / CIP 108903 / NRRL B-16338 / NBRC 102104 / LLR-40K-21) TaxID=446470 RepID=D3PU04_STANL|nr:1,2-phenylacetyl-CoA epoxidase subunit PaaC [Stackebrandtia nassauensis]ADD40950.1 phenylacetate-CoA oxygenase, PaaI subunit [Stackebrandtia nassauensis DSM 44728]